MSRFISMTPERLKKLKEFALDKTLSKQMAAARLHVSRGCIQHTCENHKIKWHYDSWSTGFPKVRVFLKTKPCLARRLKIRYVNRSTINDWLKQAVKLNIPRLFYVRERLWELEVKHAKQKSQPFN